MITERREHKILETKIVVLGAGIAGLATATQLLSDGYDVTIWAKDLPPNTTSNKAGALWQPFLCGPVEKIPSWANYSFNFYQEQLAKNPNCGCLKTRTVFIFDKVVPAPWWAESVGGIRPIDKRELPSGYIYGYELDGLVVDTDIYLGYLMKKFEENGGRIVKTDEIRDISEPLSGHDILVNCTGIGARKLFYDTSIYPSRGQVVRVKHNGFDYSLNDDEGPNSEAYIIPRRNEIVLGGTVQNYDWDERVREEETEDIIKRCSNIASQFKNAEILEPLVGLRPMRDAVRLVLEGPDNGKYVIHNYGHGGSGFTLAWGCASDVVGLVNKAVNQDHE